MLALQWPFANAQDPSLSEDMTEFNEPVPGQLPYFSESQRTPTWLADPTSSEDALVRLPSFRLESQLDSNFTDRQVLGKISVVSFFFASCRGYCPTITRNIKRAHDRYRDDPQVVFLSLSVTPNADTIDVLKSFAQKHGIRSRNWHFVRGDRKVIYRIARQNLYADMALDLGKNEDQFVHSESVYLVDRQGFVRGIYNANLPRQMDRMATDLKLLGLDGSRATRRKL